MASLADERLYPERAAELEEQGSLPTLPETQREDVERVRAELYLNVCGFAKDARVPAGVAANSRIRELMNRITELIEILDRHGKKAERAVGRPLTRDERRRLARRAPNLTALEVLDAHRRGFSGMAALRAAIRMRKPSIESAITSSTITSARLVVARPRERRSARRLGGSRASPGRQDDSDPEPPLTGRRCVVPGCGRSLEGRNRGAQTCSDRCRKRKERLAKREAQLAEQACGLTVDELEQRHPGGNFGAWLPWAARRGIVESDSAGRWRLTGSWAQGRLDEIFPEAAA